jgi:hypothetical protein
MRATICHSYNVLISYQKNYDGTKWQLTAVPGTPPILARSPFAAPLLIACSAAFKRGFLRTTVFSFWPVKKVISSF